MQNKTQQNKTTNKQHTQASYAYFIHFYCHLQPTCLKHHNIDYLPIALYFDNMHPTPRGVAIGHVHRPRANHESHRLDCLGASKLEKELASRLWTNCVGNARI